MPIEKTEPHDILGSLGPLQLKDSDSMNADNSHKDLFGPFDYTLGFLGFLELVVGKWAECCPTERGRDSTPS